VTDWPMVISHLSKCRIAAKSNADYADQAFRRGLREALFAGQDATALAQLTDLTRQRIYQIRDDRR
jgi:hypothetical protein